MLIIDHDDDKYDNANAQPPSLLLLPDDHDGHENCDNSDNDGKDNDGEDNDDKYDNDNVETITMMMIIDHDDDEYDNDKDE